MNNNARNCCDLVFLALATWREARGESSTTQLAVAYSILTRVHHPAWWGWDVQSVVFRKWQYSSLTNPHDLQLTTWPLSDDPSWNACLTVAMKALTGTSANPAPGADSYVDNSISAPSWATPENFIRQLGHLAFYRVAVDHETAN